MATKQISQLPSTSVSNDSDLLMTRQGSEDRAVAIDKVRNLGTEAGQSLAVGGYGLGGNAIPITDLFASNNADLITRDGIYQINGAANVPVAQGEIIHTQTSANSATQKVVGENQEEYARKKAGGSWLAWFLVGAANKETVRTDLNVYSKSETYSTSEVDSGFLADEADSVVKSNIASNQVSFVEMSTALSQDGAGGAPGIEHINTGVSAGTYHFLSAYTSSEFMEIKGVYTKSSDYWIIVERTNTVFSGNVISLYVTKT